MKRPNKHLSLSQTCLLDVSGELGPKAREHLQQHVATYPAAHLEYELVRGRFAMLQSLPKIEDQMDQVSKARIAAKIKKGIHQTLDAQRKARRQAKLARVFYGFMAAASGVAAALVVAAGVYIVHERQLAHRQRIVDAENTFQEVARTQLPGEGNSRVDSLARRISRLEQSGGISAEGNVGNSHMMNLLDALDSMHVTDSVPAPGDSGY